MSIAPNAVVIENDKPRFVGVKELLRISTENTLRLLELELKIKKGELEEQWHFASLERIFIEKKVYRKIEEAETWEQVIDFIDKGLKPHVKELEAPGDRGGHRAPHGDPDQAHLQVRQLQGRRAHPATGRDHRRSAAASWTTSWTTPSTTSRS